MIIMKYGKLKILIVLLLSFSLTGCNEVEMQSQWTDSITLDSVTRADWPENLQYFDENSQVLVSLMNDENRPSSVDIWAKAHLTEKRSKV